LPLWILVILYHFIASIMPLVGAFGLRSYSCGLSLFGACSIEYVWRLFSIGWRLFFIKQALGSNRIIIILPEDIEGKHICLRHLIRNVFICLKLWY